MMKKLAVLACAATLTANCTSTEITSYVDPVYRTGGYFSSVAVFADGVGLKERQIIEDEVTARFEKEGVFALRGIDIIPPTRKPTAKEWANLVIASGAETVLMINGASKDTHQTYIPPTYHPGYSYTTVNAFGVVTTHRSPGYTTGGYATSSPSAAYTAVLIDIQTGQNIWTADAISHGDDATGFDDLAHSVAQKTVESLFADDLFAKDDKQAPAKILKAQKTN